jgi:CCR4-NOT transcription complex subunit 10
MAASNRDSQSPVEDDGSLTVTAGLAKEAALFFQTGKYVDCLKVLNQLLQKKEGDLKVLHNIAIAESFQDGCSDPKKLLEVLHSVKKRSEELAYASGEHVEAAANLGKAVVGSKGTNLTAPGSSSPIVNNDEFDTYVTVFNIAVTWFHLHEYDTAFSYLESLYQNIEPIDEGTALRICLLFLDVALLTHHATRSADVINYVEKVFCANNNLITQSESGSSSQQQSSILVPKSSSVTITEGSSSDSANIVNASDSPLSRTLSEDAEYDNLFSTLDISGQNLQRPSILHTSTDLSKTQSDELISVADLRLKLHLYKVQLLLLMRNPKAAKREVKMAMNMARGKDYTMALFLKSQLEYARGNHRKAIKLLMASSNRNESGTSSLFYNNLGCIHYQLGKPSTSAAFFSKALKSFQPLHNENPLTLSNFSQDKSIFVVYNCGIQYLASGKPIPAARCFIKASKVLYKRPLVWLRIAESCLMALEKGLIKSGPSSANEPVINLRVIGEGKWRNLIVEEENLNRVQENLAAKELNVSLILARESLINALYLLDSYESDLPANPSAEEKEQKTGTSNLNSTLLDYAILRKKEKLMLKQTLLADSAFVELELENPVKALDFAKSLLKVPECSRIYKFLGNMYAAESLCILGRLKEASIYLAIYLSSADEVEPPYSQDDYKPFGGSESSAGESSDAARLLGFLSSDEARGTLFSNMGVAAALSGDLEQARRYINKALELLPNRHETVLTATYIDLKEGKDQEALARLKECRGVKFIPADVNLHEGGQ